jgi:hypothetical protein
MQTKSSSPPWNKPSHKRLVLFKSKTSTDTKTPPKERKERSIPPTKTTTTINYNQWMNNRSSERASEGFSLLHTKHLRMIPLANSILREFFWMCAAAANVSRLLLLSSAKQRGRVNRKGRSLFTPTDKGSKCEKERKGVKKNCLLGERNSDFS